MPRRFPIFQTPNPPLIVAMLGGVLAKAANGPLSRRATLAAQLALLLWAAEEITTGANWFRRSLGGVAFAYVASGKSHALRAVSCAREDSNLHGPYSPQGPQPCASTNSATGA